MFCNWENNLPVVLRLFQSRWVRSRAQTTTFECVEDRIATFCHADVHMYRPLICHKVLRTLQNPVFPWFSQKYRFPLTWETCDVWEFWDSRDLYVFLELCRKCYAWIRKISRCLTFCRCDQGFHVATVPRGVQVRRLKLGVAWATLLRPGGRDSPPPASKPVFSWKSWKYRVFHDLQIS